MNDSLKYMNDSGNMVEGDAAQAYLQNKLRSNMSGRYTQQQIDKINQSGGPAVVNSSDGYIATGPAYDRDNPTKGTAREAKAAVPLGEGKMTAEQIREKYGFSYNEEHAKQSGGYSKYGGKDNGAIYSTETGEYIGSIDGFKPAVSKSGKDDPAQGIDKFQKIEDHELEHGFRDHKRSRWNTMNDVAGAVQNLYGKEQPAQEAIEEKPNDPIRHSEELKQGTERVRTYQNDVMSGKISDDIYDTSGGYNGDNNYTFDYNKGADGIGTATGAQSNVEDKAAANFLADQTTKIKKDYNFKPVDNNSKYAYGAS